MQGLLDGNGRGGPCPTSFVIAQCSCHDFTRSLVESSDSGSVSKADFPVNHPRRQTPSHPFHSAFAVQGILDRLVLDHTVSYEQSFILAWRQAAPGRPFTPPPPPSLCSCNKAGVDQGAPTALFLTPNLQTASSGEFLNPFKSKIFKQVPA